MWGIPNGLGQRKWCEETIRALGKAQVSFQHLSSALSHPRALHSRDAGGSRFVPRTGATWDRAVLLQLDSPCRCNAWDEKAECDKVARGRVRSSTASPGFYTHPQTRRVELFDKWIYYLHCSMRLLWYPLSLSKRCLVYSGVLRYIHFHFQFSFIHHPSPNCCTHTLSSFHKQRAFLPSPIFIKMPPIDLRPAALSFVSTHGVGAYLFRLALQLLHHLKQLCTSLY